MGKSVFAGLIYSSSCGLGNDVGRCSIGCIGTRTGANAERRGLVRYGKHRQ